MSNNVKCIFANVNSLIALHRRHYLDLFLRRHNPDIVLLAEHKLSPAHRVNFKGYNMYRQNRQNNQNRLSRGGGTAVLVKEGLYSQRVILNLGSIENTCVRIKKLDGTWLTSVAVYRRPSAETNWTDLDPLSQMMGHGDVLVGGDLNAKHPSWGGDAYNRAGRELYDYLVQCPVLRIIKTGGPTRYGDGTNSYIDIFMVSPGLSFEGETEGTGLRTLDYESDHRAVEITLRNDGLAVDGPRQTFFDFDKMDINRFNRRLERRLEDCGLPVDRNVTTGEIDQCVGVMTTAFRDSMEETIPRITPGHRGLRRLPPHILNYIREKKRLRRTLYRSDPGRHGILKAQIRNLERIIQGAIAEFEKVHWTRFLEDIRVDNRTFRRVKAAAGINTREPISDLLDTDGVLVPDDYRKANLLADSVQGGRPINQDLDRIPFDSFIDREISVLDDISPIIHFGDVVSADGTNRGDVRTWQDLGFVTPPDVGAALRGKPNRRSSGVDGVPDIVLRKTGLVVWTFLTVIFNHCLNLGYFPGAWKESLTVPILKPGADPKRTNSYRPISLLSAFGKLFEHFVLSRIRETIEDLRILSDSQFGFRKGHSTSHALSVLSTYVTRSLNKKYATMAVSLDFAKAFDSAWHGGILYKMLTLGFGGNTCRIIASFLRGRTFKIRVGDQLSDSRDVVAGVPQGSLLGPVLYNILLCDIPQPPQGDLLLVYADDILIASAGPVALTVNSRLNEYLSELLTFFDKWKLTLNIEKCDSILFKGKRRFIYPNVRTYVPAIRIGNSLIRTSDTIKYLGVVFQTNFEFYRHIDRTLAKVKRIFYLYHATLRRRRGLSSDVRLLIYKQIIRPLISYAFPVWFGISSSQMERLRRWERRILVSCLRLQPTFAEDGTIRRPSCRTIYNSAGFDRIDVFLMNGALRFLERSASLDNGLVRDSLQLDTSLLRLLEDNYRPPVGLLTLDREGILYRDGKLLFYHRRFGSFDLDDLVYNTYQ